MEYEEKRDITFRLNFLNTAKKQIFAISLSKIRDTLNFYSIELFRRFKIGREKERWCSHQWPLDTCPETRRWNRTAASETHIKAVDKRKGALIVRCSSIHEVAGYGYTYVLRCAYTDPCVHVSTHAMRLLTCARVVYVCYHQHGRKRVLPCVVTAHICATRWNGFGVGRIALTFLKSPLVAIKRKRDDVTGPRVTIETLRLVFSARDSK